MRSLQTFPHLNVVRAYDIDPTRLSAFCRYWNLSPAARFDELLEAGPHSPDLVLNLTNPTSHFEVSQAALTANKHVYSEKPLATNIDDAQALCALAESKGVMLASAPCSVLGESAQILWRAIRRSEIGKAHLIYAELDDNYVPLAPYRKWRSDSGAPWPYRDEFVTGCTLEHAGYYVAWLLAIFGSVTKVIAGSANLIADKLDDGTETAPDYSSATLFFKSGVVARLTCSIIAPHDHRMRVIGDKGIIEIKECWDNNSAVHIRRRHVFRRSLKNSPFTKRLKINGPTHPKVRRWGAAAMNFALGPAEMLQALNESRPSRMSAGFALHLTEVVLAIQNANGAETMQTTCPPMEPMPWAH